MKAFVTGVAGQLGHDVVNELIGRGYSAVGSDIKPEYRGIADGSAVTLAPYVGLDITDEKQLHLLLRILSRMLSYTVPHGPMSMELRLRRIRNWFIVSMRKALKIWLL